MKRRRRRAGGGGMVEEDEEEEEREWRSVSGDGAEWRSDWSGEMEW